MTYDPTKPISASNHADNDPNYPPAVPAKTALKAADKPVNFSADPVLAPDSSEAQKVKRENERLALEASRKKRYVIKEANPIGDRAETWDEKVLREKIQEFANSVGIVIEHAAVAKAPVVSAQRAAALAKAKTDYDNKLASLAAADTPGREAARIAYEQEVRNINATK
jgi:hypothetical protein